MKKIVCTVLSLLFLFTMSGCSKDSIDEDAKKAYDVAMKELADLKSATVDAKLIMEIEGAFVKLESHIDYNANGKLQLAASSDAAYSGVKMDDIIQCYMKDDTLYYHILDTQKTKVDIKEYIDDMKSNNDFSKLSFEAKDNFKSMTMEEKDGKKYLH